jgi:UDP-N-acetylmuramoyl-L-alanyl-D-glutamate--2,6-diaminopimelate ligase
MLLSKLLENIEILERSGPSDPDITGIAYISRDVEKGYLFVIKSFDFKIEYLQDALAKGAAAVIYEIPVDLPDEVAGVKVADPRLALACAAAAWYAYPSEKLRLIGITGTKGKTTTSYMIKSILDLDGRKTGLFGNIQYIVGDDIVEASINTPESLDLQRMLASMVRQGVTDTVMEVSSQGLQLSRVGCCDFHTGVLTNVVSDHIGPKEHKDFNDYLSAKLKLFKMCRNAVINIDDPSAGAAIAAAECDNIITFGLSNEAAVKAESISYDPDGVNFEAITPWGVKIIKMKLIGRFNIYNALTAIAVCGNLGIGLDTIAAGLREVVVKGRVEMVPIDSDYTVLIDYAHNKVSLENVLTELRAYYKGRKLVCVFGCGGNRDKARRYEMGETSGELADLTIITSDNPRTEDPESIVNDIEQGIRKTSGKYVKITDRTEAIRYAMKNATKGDVIVIAGKGHEMYQDFGDHKIVYDEREVVKEIFQER